MAGVMDELRKAAKLQGETLELEASLSDEAELREVVHYQLHQIDGSISIADAKVVIDAVDDDGAYVKRVIHHLVQAGCCGAFLSHEPHSQFPQPAGRCPNCGVFLCKRHLQEHYVCVVCHRVLCRNCRRVVFRRGSVVVCQQHYPKVLGEEGEELEKCTKEVRALREEGYVVR